MLRHGETEWSRDGRHTGRTDIPLTPAGEAAAAKLRPAVAQLVEKFPLDDVVLSERWPARDEARPEPPPSRLAPPPQFAVVRAHDSGDHLLSPPGSLGVLDRAVDRGLSCSCRHPPRPARARTLPVWLPSVVAVLS